MLSDNIALLGGGIAGFTFGYRICCSKGGWIAFWYVCLVLLPLNLCWMLLSGSVFVAFFLVPLTAGLGLGGVGGIFVCVVRRDMRDLRRHIHRLRRR